MKSLSEKEIEQIIKNVKATMSFEGLEVTKEIDELGKRVLNGEISGDEAIEIIKVKYKKSSR